MIVLCLLALAGCASRGWELRGPCYRTAKHELRCTNKVRILHRFDWARA